MVRRFAILIGVMLSPVVALAQTGITGVVRDTTGAVLPGVTVEATSPVLIEKVRTVVTDDQGVYRIVDLRPGAYVVTFSLAGFSTVRREGLELTSNFMATANAELRVGALEETVTVSGASPVVDVQNVIQQRVMTAEVINALPAARNLAGFGTLVPGLMVQATTRPAPQDVGGLSGERQSMVIHGGRTRDFTQHIDGMLHNFPLANITSMTLDPGETEEFTYQLSGISAEVPTGGVYTNLIPKSGGNLFKGTVFSNYSYGSLQSDNLTDELRAQGLNAVNGLKKIWDLNPSLGGPIAQDKLWFFGSFRHWGLQEYVAGLYYDTDQYDNVYTPDFDRRYIDDYWNTNESLRLTWQATPKNKLGFYFGDQHRCACHIIQAGVGVRVTPEAAVFLRFPVIMLGQATWTAPITNRLLLQAGVSNHRSRSHNAYQPTVRPDTLSLFELSTNLLYRAQLQDGQNRRDSRSYKAAVAYVTGSHSFKGGFTLQEGTVWSYTRVNGDMNLDLLNGVPRSVTVRATPIETQMNLNADLGLYAQDQWTIKRLTLNLGVRFDYFNASVPEQHLPAARFVPARDFAEVRDVPNWTDLSTRLGAAYDLFGTGKTALKVTLSRYLDGDYTITSGSNPVNASVNTATRTWTDRNGDFFPQEEELGVLSNPSFGQVVIRTRYDDEVREGFGKRGFNWETSAGVEHELLPQVSVNATYFRRSYGNFTVTDNLLNTAADYGTFCITAPVDARLPGGGGNQICGLFDVNPTKRATNNLVTFADNFGKRTEVYNGVDLTANARLPRGSLLSGGLSFGRMVLDQCDVQGKVDNVATTKSTQGSGEGWLAPASPSVRFCHQARTFQPSVKFLGTVGLPWDVQVATTFQSSPGPEIFASYVATNAEIAPSLGRNLAAGAAGTAIVDLIDPATQYAKRIYQVDLRLAKTIGVRGKRVKGMLDFYNLFNGSPALVLNTRYGPVWLQPTYISPGRMIKLGAQVDF